MNFFINSIINYGWFVVLIVQTSAV